MGSLTLLWAAISHNIQTLAYCCRLASVPDAAGVKHKNKAVEWLDIISNDKYLSMCIILLSMWWYDRCMRLRGEKYYSCLWFDYLSFWGRCDLYDLYPVAQWNLVLVSGKRLVKCSTAPHDSWARLSTVVCQQQHQGYERVAGLSLPTSATSNSAQCRCSLWNGRVATFSPPTLKWHMVKWIKWCHEEQM